LNHSRILNSELNVKSIDFEKIIQTCVDELRYMPDLDRLHISVSVHNKQVGFANDEERLSIIFKNFISNAIKYHNPQVEKNFLRITITLSHLEALILLEDNGVGIESSYLDKIFDMFFRGPIRSEGSGLGLYIVKQTLDRLAGTVTVDSRFNKGTTFRMVIPNLQQELTSTAVQAENQSVQQS
jgi:signal transduction histidine kinase